MMQVVLKIGVPKRELKSEMAALRLFDGDGACRLIDYDEEKVLDAARTFAARRDAFHVGR